MKKVNLYTDGACRGNPGPGGYGAILRCKGYEKEISGGEAKTTNNRMELMAAGRGHGRKTAGVMPQNNPRRTPTYGKDFSRF